MGVYCKINLFKSPDGAYSPGSNVSGVIQYGVDEATVFDKITISLKGHGLLIIDEENTGDKGDDRYINREVYVDVDNVVQNEKKVPHEIGMYEARFDFKLPNDIPSTLHYYGRNATYRVKCDITYYVRIKFEKDGFLQFAKRFKKELTVVSKMKPTLPTEPIIHGEQKSLFQLFVGKKSIVNIKANIKNSVIPIGGQIDIDYEVTNDTYLAAEGVEIKLVENHAFTTKFRRVINLYKDVKYTDSKTGQVNKRNTVNLNSVINVPSDVTTLGYSKIVARNYLARITVVLPFPHINAKLDIPVEIGDFIEEIEEGTEAVSDGGDDSGLPDYDNPPPSYWEAMGEINKDEEYLRGKSCRGIVEKGITSGYHLC